VDGCSLSLNSRRIMVIRQNLNVSDFNNIIQDSREY